MLHVSNIWTLQNLQVDKLMIENTNSVNEIKPFEYQFNFKINIFIKCQLHVDVHTISCHSKWSIFFTLDVYTSFLHFQVKVIDENKADGVLQGIKEKMDNFENRWAKCIHLCLFDNKNTNGFRWHDKKNILLYSLIKGNDTAWHPLSNWF